MLKIRIYISHLIWDVFHFTSGPIFKNREEYPGNSHEHVYRSAVLALSREQAHQYNYAKTHLSTLPSVKHLIITSASLIKSFPVRFFKFTPYRHHVTMTPEAGSYEQVTFSL